MPAVLFVRPGAIAAFAAAVVFGAWCIRLAFRYAGLLQRFLPCEESSPAGAKPDGQGCVYNASDHMRYSGESGWFAGRDGADPGSLLIHAVFMGHAPHAGPLPVWHVAPRRGGAILYGALIAVFYGCHGFGLIFLAVCAATGILLVLAIVDAKTMLLPDALTLPLLWLGLAVAWLGGPVSLHGAVAGVVSGYLFLWLLSWGFRLVRRCDGMGYGDFKLFAALGAWAGSAQLPYVLLAACLSGILFACVRQKSLLPTGAYPFGPFLAVGGMGAMLVQSAIPVYGW